MSVATYFFDTMTDAQASSFNAAVDSLVVSSPLETPAGFVVTIDEAGGPITLASGQTGKTLTFADLAGETMFFSDGAELALGTTGGDDVQGSGVADALYGAGGDDTLDGGTGADLL